MIDMNMIIADNINKCLEKQQKKQVELAEYLNVSRQTVSKMLNGARTITAGELKRIAEFCCSTMEELTSVPTNYDETDIFHVFMGQVNTEAAKQSIKDIDILTELILFHDQVKENGAATREEWTDF